MFNNNKHLLETFSCTSQNAKCFACIFLFNPIIMSEEEPKTPKMKYLAQVQSRNRVRI